MNTKLIVSLCVVAFFVAMFSFPEAVMAAPKIGGAIGSVAKIGGKLVAENVLKTAEEDIPV